MEQWEAVEHEKKIKAWIQNKIIKPIKEWKKYDWPFWVLSLSFSLTFVLLITKRTYPEVENSAIIITALLGSYVVFDKMKFFFISIWHSEAGKFGIGGFSLLVLAGARIFADQQIVTTINAPASLFPRAQEALTILFSVFLWFYPAILLLCIIIVVAQFNVIVSSGKGKTWRDPSVWAQSKIFFSGLFIIVMVTFAIDRIQRTGFAIFEHAVVSSAFVKNSLAPLHLQPVRGGFEPIEYPSLRHCPQQPKDALVAFVTGDNVKDDEVMVALPSTGTRNAFTFLWGKCGAANRTEGEE